MNPKPIKNPPRYRLEQVPINRLERLQIWWAGVWDALTFVPDSTYSYWKRVEEADLDLEPTGRLTQARLEEVYARLNALGAAPVSDGCFHFTTTVIKPARKPAKRKRKAVRK